MWVALSHVWRTRNVYMTTRKINFSTLQTTFISRKYVNVTTVKFSLSLLVKPQHIKYVIRHSSRLKSTPAVNEIKRLLAAAKAEKWKLAGIYFY